MSRKFWFQIWLIVAVGGAVHFGFVNCGGGSSDYSAWTTIPTPTPSHSIAASSSSMECTLHFSYNWSQVPATNMPYGYFLQTSTAMAATDQVLWYSQINGVVADNGAIYASSNAPANTMWLSIFTGTTLTDFHQVYVEVVDANKNVLCTSNEVSYRM